jgi:hypothetical protein
MAAATGKKIGVAPTNRINVMLSLFYLLLGKFIWF